MKTNKRNPMTAAALIALAVFSQTSFADGGTSSGGDQPFGFKMQCTDDAGTARIVIADTSLGHGTATVENLKTGEAQNVEVSTHLFRYVGDTDAQEFFLRYLPKGKDVYTLLDVKLESGNGTSPRTYMGSYWGYEGLPVTTSLALRCQGDF